MLTVIGLSHKTTPVALREQWMIPEAEWPAVLSGLKQRVGIEEALLLSTCNRVEFYLVAQSEAQAMEAVKSALPAGSSAKVEDYFYLKPEEEAIRHCFRVTASLDSMVVGETQINHQVKEAYRIATQQGTIGKKLHRLLHRSMECAKRIRTETSIGEHPVSISYAAVVLAGKIFGSLRGKKVLLIGAGEMGELACKYFQERGAEIHVTNRTASKAQELAAQFSGMAHPFEVFSEHLEYYDVILTSTAATQPLLDRELLQHVMQRRKNRAMFLIDIAVPRNIAPEANKLDNLFLYNIDDLQGVITSNAQLRSQEAEQAERIIVEEGMRCWEEFKGLELAPTIQQLTQKFEQIRKTELEKCLGGEETSVDLRGKMEACTQAIVNKILHDPIMAVKTKASHPDGGIYSEILKKLFKLD